MTELRADAQRNLERVLDAAEQAFGAGALAMLAALAVLVSLLRKHHVARIEEQAASGELAVAAV